MAEQDSRGLTRRGLAKGAALAAGAFAIKAGPAAADHHGPNSVAIRGDRIVEVGRGRARVRSCRRTIDLHGATVIPGLNDSHRQRRARRRSVQV
jgi:imidazolonepropionase-like amidohydrolase